MFGLPALLGGIGVIGVIWYELAQPAGVVSYYGEKLADGVTAMCLVGLALFLADLLAGAFTHLEPQLRGSRSRVAMVALAAVVDVDGRVPDRRLRRAEREDAGVGPGARPASTPTSNGPSADTQLDPLGDSFLASVDSIRARIARDG